jgi:hypothetical protein
MRRVFGRESASVRSMEQSSEYEPLSSTICELPLPLAADPAPAWKRFPLFRGSTPGLRRLGCHASMLSFGYMPHLPHVHDDEELLLMLDGEADLVLPDMVERPFRRIRPRELVYYPAGFPHTLKTSSRKPANYLMFRWSSAGSPSGEALPFGNFACERGARAETRPAETQRRTLVKGATRWLRSFEVSVLELRDNEAFCAKPGRDTVLVLLCGALETAGRPLTPLGVSFWPDGTAQNIRGTSEATSLCLLVEFGNTPVTKSTTERWRGDHAP